MLGAGRVGGVGIGSPKIGCGDWVVAMGRGGGTENAIMASAVAMSGWGRGVIKILCANVGYGIIWAPAAVAMFCVNCIAARLAARSGPGGRVTRCATVRAVAGEGMILEIASCAAMVPRESRLRLPIGVLVNCWRRYASLAWMASFVFGNLFVHVVHIRC